MIRNIRFIVMVACSFLLTGCVVAMVGGAIDAVSYATRGDAIQQVNQKDAIEIKNPSKVKPIAITKVVAKIKRGTVIGELQSGLFCSHKTDIKWRSGNTIELSSEELVDVFREELESAGWPVTGTTEDLFTGYDVSGAEVLVAAKLTNIKAEQCSQSAIVGDVTVKGSIRIDVEWQVYSPAKRSLIGTIRTKGSALIDGGVDDTLIDLLHTSFSVAVNNLLADPAFLKLVSQSSGLAQPPESTSNLILKNKVNVYQSVSAALLAAKKSTVTVRTATGHGSGFAIGDGNLFITNAHVVGQAQHITLITSEGLNLTAKVIKVSKGRDVALIKLTRGQLPPLHIDMLPLSTADQVYAIGSPVDEQLDGSITNGIFSGTRVRDGYLWLQSNAAINPGNSGGPLLNEHGSVIGISTESIVMGGSQIGLNFFVPIGEALKYLGLSVKK